MRVTYGCKTDVLIGDPERYQMPNILTLINRASEDELEFLRVSYDALSEFAHPNFMGMGHLFVEYSEDETTVLFVKDAFRASGARVELAVEGVALCLKLTLLGWLSLGPHEERLRTALSEEYGPA